MKKALACAVGGITLAVGVLTLSATTAAAAPANGHVSPNTSSWLRESGWSGACYAQQIIVEGYNGSAHEYQYGEAVSTNSDTCDLSIEQGPEGAVWSKAENDTFVTPTWYDGPGYTDQVCVQDWTTNSKNWCSSAY